MMMFKANEKPGGFRLKDSYHESLTNSVHLVLCDPPYNIRREKDKENSGHDILTKADIDDAVLLFDDVLAKGGHGIVFCSAVQFHDWYESLST